MWDYDEGLSCTMRELSYRTVMRDMSCTCEWHLALAVKLSISKGLAIN